MQATHTDPTAGIWIDDPDRLANSIADAGQEPIALDTEFVRERTYWPQLALVQIAIDGDILLLDMQVEGMAKALAPVLTDPLRTKVMHAASEDLVALEHACGAVPKPLFDTQIAAGLAGFGAALSYQALVRELLGIEIDKGETRSDWLRRPLSPSQCRYAADDVRHLGEIHDRLQRRLVELGRLDWLTEDCQRLLTVARGEPEPWPHLALRSSQGLDPAGQRRLCMLLRWRDRQALASDRPRGWILANDLATELARHPPSDPAALARVLDARPNAPRKLRDAIWHELTADLSDLDGMPLAEPLDGRRKETIKALQSAVADIAEREGVPATVLASRRHLETYVQERRWPEALDGWRRPLLQACFRTLAPIGD